MYENQPALKSGIFKNFIGTILSAVMQPLLDWCVNISRKAQEKKTSKT